MKPDYKTCLAVGIVLLLVALIIHETLPEDERDWQDFDWKLKALVVAGVLALFAAFVLWAMNRKGQAKEVELQSLAAQQGEIAAENANV